MQANQAPGHSRVESLFEWAFLVIFGFLLAYSLVAWLELRPNVRVHNPPGMLLLATGMFLQPLASLIRRRWRVVSYMLLAASALSLVAAIRIVAS